MEHADAKIAERSTDIPLATVQPADTETTPTGAVVGPATSPEDEPTRSYITGWRLYTITFGLCLALFLSSLETSIVSTSLTSITSGLHGFDQRDWIVTSYLLTYTGFLIIYAKFSDILGRKFMILIALALFFAFSIGCGLASSMLQLIILRAFQGIGGSGIYSMVQVINPEMVRSEHWGTVVAVVSLVYILSSVLGPILGGLISERSTWRWIFLLNPPAVAVSAAIIAFLLPSNFPNHGPANSSPSSIRDKLSKTAFRKLDLIGAFLLLAASILLVFGFEEAGTKFSWQSPVIISTIVLGVVVLVAFVIYEIKLDSMDSVVETTLPLRLFKDRQFIGLLTIAFFIGMPFMTVLINTPQRFQAVEGAEAFDAGVHTLPLLLSSPFATVVASQAVARFNVPPFFVMAVTVSVQLVGLGLASSTSPGATSMWGFEVILGFALGGTLITLLIYVPFAVKREDLAVTMAILTQIRVLGGTIGLAISATILNNHLSANLPRYLDPDQIQAISGSIQAVNTLSEPLRSTVRSIFNDAYNLQLTAMLGFTAISFLATALLWERPLRRAKDVQGY